MSSFQRLDNELDSRLSSCFLFFYAIIKFMDLNITAHQLN